MTSLTDWGVTGQSAAVGYLIRSLAAGRARQSYLFTGPPQVGKSTLARAFAQALNCPESEAPCGHCRSCSRIGRGVHPDVHTIGLLADDKSEAGRLKKNIGIAQIQTLQGELSLQPYEARFRVVIIEGADLLTTEAANALLKTLEEPPDRAVVILVTTDPALLLPTVVSRCQRVELRLVSPAVIAEVLAERFGTSPDQARLLAALSGGRIGWAIQALDDSEILETRAERIDAVVAMLGEPIPERLDRAAKLAQRFNASREEVYDTIELWQSWLRDLLFAATGKAGLAANVDRLDDLKRQARLLGLPEIRDAIARLRRCRAHLQANVSPRLAIEAALADLPRVA